ncbi:hypothetical protein CCACVL1_17303 [Corchorus capsularis]|uniref:Uncharacterized protein n=1 Tax=Corchorus capsularis TaxID=210143 RepID=A0A1R3HT23_COCAP|nr:hypothetical protein CCACVL1_17303 [Corchorus capsularis]
MARTKKYMWWVGHHSSKRSDMFN